nr:HID1 [Rauvolfia tetraphylla]
MATDETAIDLSPDIILYKDGRVERNFVQPYIPPSLEDPTTGVSTKDVPISQEVSARIYLPKLVVADGQKFPILVYFHGGGFCLVSAFDSLYNTYLKLLASEAKAIVVAVEFRLTPEHPLPAGYQDCWTALQWVASHVADNSTTGTDRELWLINHGNFNKIYIGGDSTGGNMVHNIAMRAGRESLCGSLRISGAVLSYPYFLISSWAKESDETLSDMVKMYKKYWLLSYPSAPGGYENPMVNPVVDGAPSLAGIGCSRLLVIMAIDDIREAHLLYVEALKKSGWKGELELADFEGYDHFFEIFNPTTERATNMIHRIASFIK